MGGIDPEADGIGGGGAMETPARGGVADVEIGRAIISEAEAEGIGDGTTDVGGEAHIDAGASTPKFPLFAPPMRWAMKGPWSCFDKRRDCRRRWRC